MSLTDRIESDTKMDMRGVKEKLTSGSGYFYLNFTDYLASRLEDELSPKEFYEQVHEIVNEIIANKSSNPNKPIPEKVAIYAQNIGGDLLLDIGIIAKLYCPANFAKAVKEVELSSQ